MQIDVILGLMRMAEDGNKVIAKLAKMVLGMVEDMRDMEVRAGLAEAALEAEKAKVAELQATIRRLHADAAPVPVAA